MKLLSVTVSGPDKHGNRNVVLRQVGLDTSLPVDEPAYEQLQPLLKALKSARVSVSTDVSTRAGHANVRTTLLMYVGTTAGVLDRAHNATNLTARPSHKADADGGGGRESNPPTTRQAAPWF